MKNSKIIIAGILILVVVIQLVSAVSYFIPTKTDKEWNAFVNNLPSDVKIYDKETGATYVLDSDGGCDPSCPDPDSICFGKTSLTNNECGNVCYIIGTSKSDNCCTCPAASTVCKGEDVKDNCGAICSSGESTIKGTKTSGDCACEVTCGTSSGTCCASGIKECFGYDGIGYECVPVCTCPSPYDICKGVTWKEDSCGEPTCNVEGTVDCSNPEDTCASYPDEECGEWMNINNNGCVNCKQQFLRACSYPNPECKGELKSKIKIVDCGKVDGVLSTNYGTCSVVSCGSDDECGHLYGTQTLTATCSEPQCGGTSCSSGGIFSGDVSCSVSCGYCSAYGEECFNNVCVDPNAPADDVDPVESNTCEWNGGANKRDCSPGTYNCVDNTDTSGSCDGQQWCSSSGIWSTDCCCLSGVVGGSDDDSDDCAVTTCGGSDGKTFGCCSGGETCLGYYGYYSCA